MADEFFADWCRYSYIHTYIHIFFYDFFFTTYIHTYIHFCSVLSLGGQGAERTQAYTGLVKVIQTDGQILLGNKTHMFSFFSACLAWSYGTAVYVCICMYVCMYVHVLLYTYIPITAVFKNVCMWVCMRV